MRILIHSINFSPEFTGIGKYTGELAEWLASRGHELRVVTALPYYPAWRVSAGFSSWQYRKERHIIRCPLWVPRRPSGMTRLLHLASYAISSFPVMLAQALWRPEVIWLVEPPLFCSPGALITSKLCGAKTWLHVQDFEVDAAFELGLLSSGTLRRVVGCIERWLMRRFDRVSSISSNMVSRLSTKGVGSEKAVLFPNWVDTDLIYPLERSSALRREIGLADGVMVALYSGNMGNKQGLETLVEVARLLSGRSDLRFVFCGEGASKASLVSQTSNLQNVMFLPLQSLERLNELLNLADIHLLPQHASAADLVMPSKLTGMLASGKPVIASAHVNTQLAEVLAGVGSGNEIGLIVDPEKPGEMAKAICRLADDRNLRKMIGNRGREYAVRYLSKSVILGNFEMQLLGLAPVGV